MAKFQQTLCWDCARATGNCPWADRLVPVKGWKAIKIQPTATKPYGSYIVLDCPGFIRDAYDGGTRKTPREIEL